MDTQTLCLYLRELLERLLEGLLDEPDKADLEFVSGSQVIGITVSTSDGDRGKLIGHRGRNVDSIRTLCAAIASRYGHRFHLNIANGERRK